MRNKHAFFFFAASTFISILSASVGHAADQLTADQLFDPSHIVEVEITLPDADWKKLCSQSRDMRSIFSGGPQTRPFTYFKADVVIDGVKIKSVGVRKKGFIGSLDNEYPSLKIKFEEYEKQEPVAGLDRLTLNNNKQDTSQVSQFLSYKVFRDAGIHAPRSSFAKVTVNGDYLGIYSHIESVKPQFLAHSFGHDVEKPGNLYEGTIADLYTKSVDKIEAKTNKNDKTRAHINELAKLVSSDPNADLDLAKLEKIVDVDNFMQFWATEGLLRFWDGYSGNQNNYFIYINPVNDLGYFMPWGADSLFSKDGGPFQRWGNNGPTSIYGQSMLANRLYNTKGIPERYRKTMVKLLDEVWKEDTLLDEIDRIEKLITPHLHERQDRAVDSMDDIRDFILSRRDVINKELKDWPAELPTEPRKPFYAIPVADLAGTFSTTWQSTDPEDPTTSGKAAVTLKLTDADAPVTWKQIGVYAKPMERPRWGRRGGPGADWIPPVNLIFVGNRAEDNERVTVSLFADRAAFESAENDDPINVSGMMTEGESRRGGFGPWGGGGQSVSGQLHLTKSGTSDGDAVEGRIDLKIVEMRGGMFDRRNRGGDRDRDRGGDRDRERTPPSPPRVPDELLHLQKTLDVDGNGELSATELKNAAATLRKLDTNSDGTLTAPELLKQ